MWINTVRYAASGVIGIFAAIALYLGLSCFFNVNALLNVAQPAQAVVAQGEAGKQFAWQAPDGQHYTQPVPVPGILFPDYAIGDTVAILYDPGNPGYWKVNNFAGLRLWGLAMDGLGIGLLIFAAAVLPGRRLRLRHHKPEAQTA